MQTERFGGWTRPMVQILQHQFYKVSRIQTRATRGRGTANPSASCQANAIWDQARPSQGEPTFLPLRLSLLLAIGAVWPSGTCRLSFAFRRATRRLSAAWLNLNLRLTASAGEPRITWT
jgi:hypothetical protein